MAAVLVVDDDHTVREVVVSYLRAAGHRVTEAADGPEALRSMRDEPADLVVLDLMLPGIDGLELCPRLREQRDVPIDDADRQGSTEDRVARAGERVRTTTDQAVQPARVGAAGRLGVAADR